MILTICRPDDAPETMDERIDLDGVTLAYSVTSESVTLPPSAWSATAPADDDTDLPAFIRDLSIGCGILES